MATYRVRPGYIHGAFNQHQAGAVVELSEEEAAGLLDKLERVEELALSAVEGRPKAGKQKKQPDADGDQQPDAAGDQQPDAGDGA